MVNVVAIIGLFAAISVYAEVIASPWRLGMIHEKINILGVIGAITLLLVIYGTSACQTTGQRALRSQSDSFLLDRDVYRGNYSPNDDVYRPKP